MSRRWRLVLILLAILILLILAGRWFLTSPLLSSQIATQLETRAGAPVQVEGVDVGVTGSTLSGLQLAAPGQPEPWFSVDSLAVDVSLWGLLVGDICPTRVELAGPTLRLRFAEDGSLATRFPGKFEPVGGGTVPAISFERGRLVLQKKGQPDLIFSEVTGKITSESGQVKVTATAVQPRWGSWQIDGATNSKGQMVVLNLRSTQPVAVDMEMLRGLPFVPASVWREVEVEGTTPAVVTLRYETGSKKFRYRVELEPIANWLMVPSVGLRASRATGKVIIENNVVHLKDVSGQAFAGKISTAGKLDFQGPATFLQFERIEVERLDVGQLPRRWNLPPQIEGRLEGRANLDVNLGNGPPQFHGQGHARITLARVGGQPTAEPIRLEMKAAGTGLQWQRQPILPPLPPPRDGEPLELVEPPEPDRLDELAHHPSLLLQEVHRQVVGGAGRLVRGMQRLAHQPWPQPGQPERYLDIQLKMEDVDLAPFLKKLEVKLPFNISGRVSFAVEASLPLDAPADLRRYRASGHVRARDLTLARLGFRELGGQVRLRAGQLQLTDLRAILHDGGPAAPAPGWEELRGQATLQLSPPGDLVARLEAGQVSLNYLDRLVGQPGLLQGACSAAFQARVPVGRLSDSTAWKVDGKLTAGPARVAELELNEFRLGAILERGLLRLEPLKATIEGAVLVGSGQIELMGTCKFQGHLALTGGDLNRLARMPALQGLPLRLAGSVAGTLQCSGTLIPLTLLTAGRITANSCRLNQFELPRVEIPWKADLKGLTVAGLVAESAGGTLRGDLELPFDPEQAAVLQLQARDVQVGALLRGLVGRDFLVSGKGDASFKATLFGAPAGLARNLHWEGELNSSTLRLASGSLDQVQGKGVWRQGVLRYGLKGRFLGGRLEANGELLCGSSQALVAPGESHWRLQGGLLAQVLRWGGGDDPWLPLQGQVDAELTFRHRQRDWLPVGQGRLQIDALRWHNNELAGAVRGDVRLEADTLRLVGLAGHLGTGLVRGEVHLSLRDMARSSFRLLLERMEAQRLLAPWLGEAAAVQGPLGLHLVGTLWPHAEGTGVLTLDQGRIGLLEVSEMRMPFQWHHPGLKRLTLMIREAHADAARGRIIGQGQFAWEHGVWQMQGQLRFNNLEVRHLVGENGRTGPLSQGILTGRCEFSGQDVRGWNDVAASVKAEIHQLQPWDVPVLQQLRPILGPAAELTFAHGELSGRLAGGVFRIQRLTLEQGLVQLYTEGTVTLSGRLELEVFARTGRLPLSSEMVRRLGLRIPAQGPLPTRLLTEARTLFNGRLITLRITGTIRHPTIQVAAWLLPGEEAVRFFLRQLPLP